MGGIDQTGQTSHGTLLAPCLLLPATCFYVIRTAAPLHTLRPNLLLTTHMYHSQLTTELPRVTFYLL